jgi:hypothetical protein
MKVEKFPTYSEVEKKENYNNVVEELRRKYQLGGNYCLGTFVSISKSINTTKITS